MTCHCVPQKSLHFFSNKAQILRFSTQNFQILLKFIILRILNSYEIISSNEGYIRAKSVVFLIRNRDLFFAADFNATFFFLSARRGHLLFCASIILERIISAIVQTHFAYSAMINNLSRLHYLCVHSMCKNLRHIVIKTPFFFQNYGIFLCMYYHI